MDHLASFFDAQVLAAISRLKVAPGKAVGGGRQSDRTARRTGTGTEFADHREYIHGDDPRQIDWRLYGRTGKFFTKLYHSEEDRCINIALDCSSSMASPEKLSFAKKLAAALVFLAGAERDSASVFPFDRRVRQPLRSLVGTHGFKRCLAWLQDLEPGGATDISAVSREIAELAGMSGPVIVISDLMDQAILSSGWPAALAGGGREAAVIQVFSKEDREPPFRGYTRIQDAEGGSAMPVLVDARLAKRYTRTFDRFCLAVGSRCTALGIPYARVRTDQGVTSVLLEDLRKAGVTA